MRDMATETRTVVIDDLSGKEIPADKAVTLQFSYGGATYEIDLSPDNAQQMDNALQPFVSVARRVGGRAASKPNKNAAPAGTSLQEIRDWAKANGHTVSDRGRVSAEILSAYRQAHK